MSLISKLWKTVARPILSVATGGQSEVLARALKPFTASSSQPPGVAIPPPSRAFQSGDFGTGMDGMGGGMLNTMATVRALPGAGLKRLPAPSRRPDVDPGGPFPGPSNRGPAAGAGAIGGFGLGRLMDGSRRKRRTMNTLNPRALRRAIRRVVGFQKFQKAINKLLPSKPRPARPAAHAHRHTHRR